MCDNITDEVLLLTLILLLKHRRNRSSSLENYKKYQEVRRKTIKTSRAIKKKKDIKALSHNKMGHKPSHQSYSEVTQNQSYVNGAITCDLSIVKQERDERDDCASEEDGINADIPYLEIKLEAEDKYEI